MQEACNKEFQQLNNEWTQWVGQYGRWSTGKYFHRRDGSSTLYLYLYHPSLYDDITQWLGDHGLDAPEPEDTIWAAFLIEEGSRVPTLTINEV